MRLDVMHPSAIVTGARGGAILGRLKRLVVRRLYNHLATAYKVETWTTMNYGFAPVAGETGFDPVPQAAAERHALALYWRVATSGARGAALGGLDLVEIGSGRGGGAAFLAAALDPRQMTGIDVAEAATTLARQRYGAQQNLRFVTGDAEGLPLDEGSFDIVINIESAHCYASVPRFLAEVARVLRPGGELLFAGFAARGAAHRRLVDALEGEPGLRLDRLDDITPNIVRSLALDEARKRSLIDAHVRGLFKSFAVGAYAMQGSAMRRALERGETAYLAAALTRR